MSNIKYIMGFFKNKLNFGNESKLCIFLSDITATFYQVVFQAKSKVCFCTFLKDNYFYIEKWTFKGMWDIYYRAKRDKKEATCL